MAKPTVSPKSPAVAAPKINPSKSVRGLGVPALHGKTGGARVQSHGIKPSVKPVGTPKGL